MQQTGIRWTTRCASVLAVAALAGAIVGSSPGGHSSANAAERGSATEPPSPGAALRLTRSAAALSASGAASLHHGSFHPVAATAAGAATCGATPGLICSQVVVPLDRTGVTPGTITLRVETLPPVGVSRGVIFLIAGGPGQGSASSFDLGDPASANFNRFVFPGYTLVAYDDRGTGDSGVLRCPALQNATTTTAETSNVPLCAELLGPSRDFYGTADHAEDLEAVRLSLGIDRVALFGVSYGTKLALAYSLIHPDHVERLLLDSVLPPELPDPFFSNVLKQLPSRLSGFCANAICKGATTSYAADVTAVLNQLAAKPYTGRLLHTTGKTSTVKMTADDLLSVLIDADLNPGLAATLPAAFHQARQGHRRALLRIYAYGSATSLEPAEDLSTGLFAATTCHDGPFPWLATTAVSERIALIEKARAALPSGSFGPFGSWAAHLGNADFCLRWPAPSGGVTYGAGVYPNVPVLAVSGGFDMRTPTDSAVAVAARFPQGKVLNVPGVGHSTVTADPSSCAPLQVRAWMLGQPVSDCPRVKPYVQTVPALPPVVSPKDVKLATPRETLALVATTVREAEAVWNMNFPSAQADGAVAGLYAGSLISIKDGFRLAHYGIAPGVEVSGSIRVTSFVPQLTFDGVITVDGDAAAHGVLGIDGARIGGTLGGEIVSR